MHAAVWSSGNEICVAVFNVKYVSRKTTVRKCIFSKCVKDDGGDVHKRFRDSIHEVAREVQRQLEAAGHASGIVVRFLWGVIVALVTFMFYVLLLPFRGPQFA